MKSLLNEKIESFSGFLEKFAFDLERQLRVPMENNFKREIILTMTSPFYVTLQIAKFVHVII